MSEKKNNQNQNDEPKYFYASAIESIVRYYIYKARITKNFRLEVGRGYNLVLTLMEFFGDEYPVMRRLIKAMGGEYERGLGVTEHVFIIPKGPYWSNYQRISARFGGEQVEN